MHQPQSLGPLILARRRELGRSQERIAELMCEALGRATVTKNEISRYEREERVPTAASLRALATALELTLECLEQAAGITRRLRATPDRAALDATKVGVEVEREGAETDRRKVLHHLAAVVAGTVPAALVTPDETERITGVFANPERLDHETLNFFRSSLTQQYSADQALGPPRPSRSVARPTQGTGRHAPALPTGHHDTAASTARTVR